MSSHAPLDERPLELIHAVVDGSATPEEAQELLGLLDSDPRVREALEAFQATAQDLDALPMEEPPPSLKGRVMQALQEQKRGVSKVVPFRRRTWVLGGLWAAAAAALLVYLALPHGVRPPVSGALAAGTMADLDLRTWPLITEVKGADAGGVPADLSVRKREDRFLVRTELRTASAKPLVLTWDKGQFILVSASPGLGYLSAQSGYSELIIPAGMTGPVALMLGPREGAEGSGSIRLTQDGQDILHTTVKLR